MDGLVETGRFGNLTLGPHQLLLVLQMGNEQTSVLPGAAATVTC